MNMFGQDKEEINMLRQELNTIRGLLLTANNRIVELEDDSGESIIKRLRNMAREAGLDIHGEEYQAMMNRAFLDVAGRSLPAMAAYSKTVFLKDNPQELLDRAAKLTQQASMITKQLEKKKK